jgi:hypothetical protein
MTNYQRKLYALQEARWLRRVAAYDQSRMLKFINSKQSAQADQVVQAYMDVADNILAFRVIYPNADGTNKVYTSRLPLSQEFKSLLKPGNYVARTLAQREATGKPSVPFTSEEDAEAKAAGFE